MWGSVEQPHHELQLNLCLHAVGLVLRTWLLQAAAAAGSALTERLGAFKASLLAELEGGLLGAWGSQLKVAAAAEAAQQVDAGLQVRGNGAGCAERWVCGVCLNMQGRVVVQVEAGASMQCSMGAATG